MSSSAFQKISRGLEEAKAYLEGRRERYRVTVPSGIPHWTDLKHKALPEKREELKQEALAELKAVEPAGR